MTDVNTGGGRRKHKRYNLSDGISIHSMANKGKTGQVIDIGLGGLMVRYHDPKRTAEPLRWRLKKAFLPGYSGFYRVSITVNGEESGLKQVQCKTVAEDRLADTSHPGNETRKCLKFGTVRHDQTFHLRQLIRNHAVRQVKDRRQLTDRRKNIASELPADIERREWWRNRRGALH